jgi:hypothetical protein
MPWVSQKQRLINKENYAMVNICQVFITIQTYNKIFSETENPGNFTTYIFLCSTFFVTQRKIKKEGD